MKINDNKYKGVIYCYCLNGKYYVGKTCTEERKRMDKHRHDALTRRSDTPFARAIRKYGWEETVKSYRVLEEVFAPTDEEMRIKLAEAEDRNIIAMNALIPNGYNVYLGGQVSIPHVNDKEEMYKKISNSLKGKYLNQEYSSKPVYCFETDTWYPSEMEAERQTGISHDSIGRSALGKNCKAGGLSWSYDGKPPRESKIKSKEIKCVETGQVFKSMRDVARYLQEQGSTQTLDHLYSRVKASVKNGWRCEGYHWEHTGKTIPCYQVRNQFGSVTTIP